MSATTRSTATVAAAAKCRGMMKPLTGEASGGAPLPLPSARRKAAAGPSAKATARSACNGAVGSSGAANNRAPSRC